MFSCERAGQMENLRKLTGKRFAKVFFVFQFSFVSRPQLFNFFLTHEKHFLISDSIKLCLLFSLNKLLYFFFLLLLALRLYFSLSK